MNQVQARGAILSHVEAIYRPENRELAVALFEALRCKVHETGTKSLSGSDYLSVHPDRDRLDGDDVIYLSEMNSDQLALEDNLLNLISSDDSLARGVNRYSQALTARPYGFSHIAIVYPNYESLNEAIDGLEDRLSDEVKSRTFVKTYRGEFEWESIQTFVYTDLAVAGISAFGQVYELAAYGPIPDKMKKHGDM